MTGRVSARRSAKHATRSKLVGYARRTVCGSFADAGSIPAASTNYLLYIKVLLSSIVRDTRRAPNAADDGRTFAVATSGVAPSMSSAGSNRGHNANPAGRFNTSGPRDQALSLAANSGLEAGLHYSLSRKLERSSTFSR